MPQKDLEPTVKFQTFKQIYISQNENPERFKRLKKNMSLVPKFIKNYKLL